MYRDALFFRAIIELYNHVICDIDEKEDEQCSKHVCSLVSERVRGEYERCVRLTGRCDTEGLTSLVSENRELVLILFTGAEESNGLVAVCLE